MVRTERPPPAEPSTRRIIVPAYRRAVVELFGEEGRQRVIERLEGDSREEFVRDPIVRSEWVAVRHVVAWSFAVWEGPADRQRPVMAELVRRQWDLGFGFIRRMLLHLAPPDMIVSRLPALWKQDHSSGALEAELDPEGRGANIYLEDSPYIETPQGRASMAEVYRHAFAQTRARDVTETHALETPARMVLRLRWK